MMQMMFLETILPGIINCSKLYFSECRITCPRYWSFRDFIVFTTPSSLSILSSALNPILVYAIKYLM